MSSSSVQSVDMNMQLISNEQDQRYNTYKQEKNMLSRLQHTNEEHLDAVFFKSQINIDLFEKN